MAEFGWISLNLGVVHKWCQPLRGDWRKIEGAGYNYFLSSINNINDKALCQEAKISSGLDGHFVIFCCNFFLIHYWKKVFFLVQTKKKFTIKKNISNRWRITQLLILGFIMYIMYTKLFNEEKEKNWRKKKKEFNNNKYQSKS